MTSRVVRMGEKHQFPGMLKEVIISCDQMDCPIALSDTDIRESGGLEKMGWSWIAVNGDMRHYCPAHRRTPSTKE